MDLKKIFQYLLAAFLGYIIISELYALIFSTIMILLLNTIGEAIIGIHPYFFGIPGTIVIILGIYSGIKSLRDKNIYYKIFKPEKKKILISLLLSITLVAIASIVLVHAFVYTQWGIIQPISPIIGIPGAIISYTILFYPFSCLFYHFYDNRRNKDFKAKKRVIALTIIMNPIFIFFSIALNVIIGAMILTEPCGVTYQGFLPDSAARDTGMKPQEVIVKIDDIEIKNIDDMSNYLAAISFNKTITIQTDKGNEYHLTLRFYEPENKYMLGITNVTTYYCRKNL